MILIQAIRNAMVNDLVVVRKVAELATVPTGQPARQRKSEAELRRPRT
jgi:hypothetical protein